MLRNEEIVRLKVREAIQRGLEAQQIQRALKEQKSQQVASRSVVQVPVTHSSSKMQTKPGRAHTLLLPLIAFLKF
jgi:hypothetical protein